MDAKEYGVSVEWSKQSKKLERRHFLFLEKCTLSKSPTFTQP